MSLKKKKNCLKRHLRVSSCFLRIKLEKVYWEMLQFFWLPFFFLRVKKQIQFWNNYECWAHCFLKYTTAAYQCQIFTVVYFCSMVLHFLFCFWCCSHPEIIWFGVSFLYTGLALWNSLILSAIAGWEWSTKERWTESQPCPTGWSLLWLLKSLKTLGCETTHTLRHCCLIPALIFQTFPGTWATQAGQSRWTDLSMTFVTSCLRACPLYQSWKPRSYVSACSEDWFSWKRRA